MRPGERLELFRDLTIWHIEVRQGDKDPEPVVCGQEVEFGAWYRVPYCGPKGEDKGWRVQITRKCRNRVKVCIEAEPEVRVGHVDRSKVPCN
jgi:hypothetical protein